MTRIILEPTIAMQAGESVVDQCPECGALVCWHPRLAAPGQRKKLAVCPACGSLDAKWWRQQLPVGPFEAETHTHDEVQRQADEFDDALDAFKSAALRLGRAWESIPGDILGDSYPQHWQSFDDEVLHIRGLEVGDRRA